MRMTIDLIYNKFFSSACQIIIWVVIVVLSGSALAYIC